MTPGADQSARGDSENEAVTPHELFRRAGQSRGKERAKQREREMDRVWRQRNSEHIREYKSLYRQENRDQLRAYRNKYNAEHREQNNRAERIRQQRRRAEQVRRRQRQEKARERVRRWTAAHPDQKRESIRRWRESHPEKMAEYSRRYYERNRDMLLERARQRREQQSEKVAAATRAWQQRNRAHLTERQREHRAADPEGYARVLESNREARRLHRRLQALDLPAKRIKRTAVREREANEAAARDYFERRQMKIVRERAIANYERTPPDLLLKWSRTSALARRRAELLEHFPAAVENVVKGDLPRIAGEIAMDQRARMIRQLEPLDVAAELRQRVFDEAGGQELLRVVPVWPVAAAIVVEEALPHQPSTPANPPGGGQLVWVPAHERGGVHVAAHWRRQRSR